MRIRFQIFLVGGLVLLSLAFLFSIFLGVGVFGEEYRVVAAVDADPNGYLSLVGSVVIYGILPLAVSLALLTFTHVKDTLAESVGLGHRLFIFVGAFFILWGSLYLFFSYDAYSRALDIAHVWATNEIDGILLIIYSTYFIYSIFWIIIGLFLAIASASRLYD